MMHQSNTVIKVALWTLFGFVLIKTVHAIISFLIHFYVLYGFTDGFVLIHFKYYVPAFSFLVTLIFSILLILILNKKKQTLSIGTIKIPVIWFINFTVISILSAPLIEKGFNNYFKSFYEDLSKSEYLSNLNLDTIFNIKEICVYASQWLIVILLFVYCSFKLRKNGNGNEKIGD